MAKLSQFQHGGKVNMTTGQFLGGNTTRNSHIYIYTLTSILLFWLRYRPETLKPGGFLVYRNRSIQTHNNLQ